MCARGQEHSLSRHGWVGDTLGRPNDLTLHSHEGTGVGVRVWWPR